MTYYTRVTNYQKEEQIFEFLKTLPDTEDNQNLKLQFKFIANKNYYSDYWLAFNSHSLRIWTLDDISLANSKEVNLTEFLANIEKTINTLNKEKSMRQLTLENYNTLTEDEVIIVYQDKTSNLPVKPLMILTTHISASNNPNNYINYGFTNLANPLIPFRSFESGDKISTIRAAIESGMDVYVAESINKIFFSGEKGQQQLPAKEITVKKDPGHIAQIEAYIHYLLRQHTEYLIAELGMTQYPKETYRETTEVFLIEKLK